jgi:hypothetical protein
MHFATSLSSNISISSDPDILIPFKYLVKDKLRVKNMLLRLVW